VCSLRDGKWTAVSGPLKAPQNDTVIFSHRSQFREKSKTLNGRCDIIASSWCIIIIIAIIVSIMNDCLIKRRYSLTLDSCSHVAHLQLDS